MRTVLAFVFPLVIGIVRVHADVVTFENDYDGFVEAAGPLSVIDFETLPDGSPSMSGVELTDDFNYDTQGIHFDAPLSNPYIAGNAETGFGLVTTENVEDTWIIGDFITPGQAIGGFFPGSTELCAFDAKDQELACVSASTAPGIPGFVGIVSDVPIHGFTFGSGTSTEGIHSVEFSPIPEPGALVLIGSSAFLLLRRGARQRN